ncbi:MAG: hypothetical protein RR555_01080 [Bacteroidales bacterium]
MKNLKIIIPLLFSLLIGTSIQGQNTNSNKNKQQADMKEFDNTSFSDAQPVKIHDTTLLTQHLIGVKWGYAISNVGFSQQSENKSIKSPANFGVYYTYYHSLWKSMPYFGLHTGLEFTELGFTEVLGTDQAKTETEQRYKAISIPFMTQFRVDFWKMRLMLGVGAFGTYLLSTNLEGGIPSTTNKVGCGIIAGGGIAVKFNPIELHIECNYKYSLSHFLNPQIYSTEYWLYTHANQLQISLGVFYNLSTRKKK